MDREDKKVVKKYYLRMKEESKELIENFVQILTRRENFRKIL